MIRRVGQTIIECHHDVGPEGLLYVDGSLGTEEMRAPVEMAPKTHAILPNFAQSAQAEDLVPPAVGEYWAVPSHELMQSTQSTYGFMPRSQHQVIGIAEQNLHGKEAELIRCHRLYGGLGSHRHEDWRFDDAVCEMKPTASCARARVFRQEFKLHQIYSAR